MGRRGPHKKFFDGETVFDLLRQGYSIVRIAKRWECNPMTVYRRLAEERERIEQQERLLPMQDQDKFEVVITLQYSHTAITRKDTTATKAILITS